jgi:hypothetical protein
MKEITCNCSGDTIMVSIGTWVISVCNSLYLSLSAYAGKIYHVPVRHINEDMIMFAVPRQSKQEPHSVLGSERQNVSQS